MAAVTADGAITAATADGRGGWFLAGSFGRIDGQPRRNLAHIRADGSLDAGWHGPRLRPAAALTFLSLARDGSRLLVAGGFSDHGRRRPGVVALRTSDGGLDTGWRPQRVCFDGDWAVRAAPTSAARSRGSAGPRRTASPPSTRRPAARGRPGIPRRAARSSR